MCWYDILRRLKKVRILWKSQKAIFNFQVLFCRKNKPQFKLVQISNSMFSSQVARTNCIQRNTYLRTILNCKNLLTTDIFKSRSFSKALFSKECLCSIKVSLRFMRCGKIIITLRALYWYLEMSVWKIYLLPRVTYIFHTILRFILSFTRRRFCSKP